MGRKFAVRMETPVFNKVASNTEYKEKYEGLSLQYAHNLDEGHSTFYFGDGANEQ